MFRGNRGGDYRTNPKNKVYITYKIKSITGETKEKTEEMRSVYSGIFTKDVIMFFGEEIEYYFEEISETDSIETKKYTMKINQKDIFNDEGRFGMLNGMMICKELPRDVFPQRRVQRASAAEVHLFRGRRVADHGFGEAL